MKLKPRDKSTILTRIVITLALYALVTLTGCANLKQSAQASVAADATTTVVGVASGIVVEANPLITGPISLATSVLLRLLVINEIDKLPEAERVKPLAQINSLTWGIAASNLAVIVSASNPFGLMTGLMVGLSVWQSTKEERLAAETCEFFKQNDPTFKVADCLFFQQNSENF